MVKTAGILSHLNSTQRQAVVHQAGPLLILAGPGSGKTRVLTHRAAWLIKEQGIDPHNLLLLTFTNKAAQEMKDRLGTLLGLSSNSTPHLPFAGTFHSFCARTLRIEGRHLGLPPNYLIYDGQDQLAVIKEAIKQTDQDYRRFRPALVLNMISQAKNELVSALEYPQYAQGDFQTGVARIYLTYQRLLKEFAALDFDDLLMETVRLFQKQPSVLAKYQNQFIYLLVDEYQDTNQAQYLLTRQLAGRWRNLTVVGDASQAIYGFRGANYRNLVDLKKDFPELKVVNLEQNYRSTQKILNIATAIISKNQSHPVLKLWTKNDLGQPALIYQAKDEQDEAFFVVSQIKQLIEQRNETDLAVLYRTNAQSRVLEEALLASEIPYLLVGGVRFYERKEVKDCLAFLRLLVNSQDKVSLKRIEKLGKKRKEKFLKWQSKLKEISSLTTLKLLDEIFKQTGILELYDSDNEQDLARLENIKELRSVASNYPNLPDFLESVALIEREYLAKNEVGLVKQKHQGVTLTTIHAAKGTEFGVVFIVGMEEGLFPHLKSLGSLQEIEEERRLCYVAITRAKEKLFLSFASQRLIFGQHLNNPISRFITEIPEDEIEFVNTQKMCQDDKK